MLTRAALLLVYAKPARGLSEKARGASGRDNLALTRVGYIVAGVQQLHERNDAIAYRAAVQVIDRVEVFRRRLPGVLDEFREGVVGLEICEARTRHACIGDQQVDVSDILAHEFGDLFEFVLVGDVGAERNDAFAQRHQRLLFKRA